MPEYGFSLTRIFSYKGGIVDSGSNGIYDSILIRENAGQRKPFFRHMLRSARPAGNCASRT